MRLVKMAAIVVAVLGAVSPLDAAERVAEVKGARLHVCFRDLVTLVDDRRVESDPRLWAFTVRAVDAQDGDEVELLPHLPEACFYSQSDDDAVTCTCPPGVRELAIDGRHHFLHPPSDDPIVRISGGALPPRPCPSCQEQLRSLRWLANLDLYLEGFPGPEHRRRLDGSLLDETLNEAQTSRVTARFRFDSGELRTNQLWPEVEGNGFRVLAIRKAPHVPVQAMSKVVELIRDVPAVLELRGRKLTGGDEAVPILRVVPEMRRVAVLVVSNSPLHPDHRLTDDVVRTNGDFLYHYRLLIAPPGNLSALPRPRTEPPSRAADPQCSPAEYRYP